MINLKKINLIYFLILSFPISLLVGSLIIEVYIFLINIIFLKDLFIKKRFSFLNNNIFKYCLILWAYLLINLALSIDIENSILRSVGFVRFVLFAFAISFYLGNNEGSLNNLNIEKVFFFWTIILMIVSIDLFYESIFGKNIIGNVAGMYGRLSGFLGDELKIGYFHFGFITLVIAYIMSLKNKNKLIIFLPLFLIIINYLIGERSNFIRSIISVSILFFFLPKKYFKIKILTIIVAVILTILITSLDSGRTARYYDRFIKPIANNGVKSYFKQSVYGAHYNTAIEITKNYPIFGIGLKNFIKESPKEIYINKEYRFNYIRVTTHPHQLYFELLSELGIIGFFTIYIFFYIYNFL